jgi:sulfur carrier protein ThiS
MAKRITFIGLTGEENSLLVSDSLDYAEILEGEGVSTGTSTIFLNGEEVDETQLEDTYAAEGDVLKAVVKKSKDGK